MGWENYRAELGRATWKFFHTMMARYPEHPTEEEQEALRSFVYLFSRLYPWWVAVTLRAFGMDGSLGTNCSPAANAHLTSSSTSRSTLHRSRPVTQRRAGRASSTTR